jgi:hypothetical protein
VRKRKEGRTDGWKENRLNRRRKKERKRREKEMKRLELNDVVEVKE